MNVYINSWLGKEQRAEHILVAETALGHRLPNGAEIHHVNGIKSDNRNANLVICPSRQYHFLLHTRQRALDSCGNANWRRCGYCGAYDDPVNLHIVGRHARHSRCATEYRKYRRKLKEAAEAEARG